MWRCCHTNAREAAKAAIEIRPDAFAVDPDRLARLDREARTRGLIFRTSLRSSGSGDPLACTRWSRRLNTPLKGYGRDEGVLLDTGSLVAYLSRNDRHHAWAVRCSSAFYAPFWTCEAVLVEAVFRLQSDGGDAQPILRLLDRGVLLLEFSCAAHRADIRRLLRKYKDQRMSVADACLVRMAELTESCQVFTTDRDFLVYRRRGRHVVPGLAPFWS